MKDSTQQQTIQGLKYLLERLDTDHLRAADRYYRLLGVLTLFLEHRMGRAVDSDDLARKTLDTVAEKLAQGEDIQNIQAYSFGVARNLLSAYRRRAVHESMDDRLAESLRDDRQMLQETITKEVEEECRHHCLRSLSPEKRNLIIRYYSKGLHAKDYKAQLAKELGITTEALSNRISRIKKKLSECRQDCIRVRREAALHE